MPNPELVGSFLSYLRREQGCAKNTVAAYETDLRKFYLWWQKPLQEVQRTDLQTYLAKLLESGVSGRSAARKLSCLRHFYRFLIDDEEAFVDPTRNLPVPKTWKTLPKSLGSGDLGKMVESLGFSWISVRDKAILLTFFASGLRVSELANLKMKDLELEASAARVWNGKGGKDGIVPLNPIAIQALKQYLAEVRPKLAEMKGEPYVFLGRHGQRLTRQQIHNRVGQAAKVALDKHVSSHFLRHGFATALIEGGADIRDVQALMRHSSVETTAIYIHTDLNYLRRIYYASHPRAYLAQTAN